MMAISHVCMCQVLAGGNCIAIIIVMFCDYSTGGQWQGQKSRQGYKQVFAA